MGLLDLLSGRRPDPTAAWPTCEIGQDNYLPQHPALTLSKPQITGGVKLTQETRTGDLRKLFGSAEPEDADSEETILTYARSGITLEFEVNAKGLLKRWNLYPRNEDA